jgi:hypothetical protein
MSRTETAYWERLHQELELWHASGRVARLWWRDDDAIEDTDALRTLIAIAEHTPVAIAVIPAFASDRVASLAQSSPCVSILQHGWNHLNHAGPADRKAELALHRPLKMVLCEIAKGRDRIRNLFGANCLPVLVPPWGNIADEVLLELPRHGVTGISCHGKLSSFKVPGLLAFNTHIDIIDWRAGAQFIGAPQTLSSLVTYLQLRRRAGGAECEPIGLLTHHLMHNDELNRFLSDFLAITKDHPSLSWQSAADLFACNPNEGQLPQVGS